MPNNVALKPLALLCAFTILSLTGCDDSSGKTAQAQEAPEVQVLTLNTQSLAVSTELPGRTSAFRVAEVRPQVSGIILKRAFTEGSDVVAGQTLYQIDPAPFRASFNNAKAAVSQAEANARIAQVTLNRYRSLTGTNYISRQDFDQAEATAAQTRAAVEAASAAQETARINLAWSTITSPISGRIGRSSVTEGALVQNAQSDALATVQQLDPMYVDVTQSSGDFLRLQQELASGKLRQNAGKAVVSVIMGDGAVYPRTGTLAFSDVTVDQTTGSITLRAIVPNPDHTLLPGMFVRARLDEGTDPQALLIPQQAVTRTPRGEATTLVVGSDNKVEVRTISVSQAEGDKWRVNGGLQAGERVIVSGIQRAQPGMTVKPVAANASSSSSTGTAD
ncbi:efflux RND transporter periplasmic adaptor subunit [Pantoea cypripedii]|uniref:Efflux transporter periplasmic adaptor subunit n=1 Tax=Pantoea cypripedii TaxID=55209 RepID=A0A1X1ELZ4_PANCY|nr:efflux RND transporter periplasmic adaptor subunit [Pantoea cypripedii]MBP2198692.1 membrane fusion protein (multidrug efflux system) [Pantoea cypripedii]ORM89970.1 efflux transporter periplasmic adaptor subunit [Pantoea cypripedii]